MPNWRKKSPQAQTLKVGAAAGGFAIGGPIGAFVASFVLDKYSTGHKYQATPSNPYTESSLYDA